MRKDIVRPHLIPLDERFSAEFRLAVRPGDLDVDEHEGGIVRGWDPSTPTTAHARLSADLQGALGDMLLGSQSRLGASLWWRATRTGLRGVVATGDVLEGVTSLSSDLVPGRLGGQLTLGLDVYVLSADSQSPLSPDRLGLALWSTQRSWLLEGKGERFPIEVVDFGAAGMRGSAGAWVLRWYQKDPTASTSAAVRLRLNRSHPVASRLNGLDPSDPAHSVLRRDVIRELIDVACEIPEFQLDATAWPQGSLGHALSVLLAGVMPGITLADLRAMREHERDDLESLVQELTGFFQQEGPRA